MCNGYNEPICRGFGYRPHQPGPQCPTPPPPSDPVFLTLSAADQWKAVDYWTHDIEIEVEELKARRWKEYGL